jgi:hypothetical protein
LVELMVAVAVACLVHLEQVVLVVVAWLVVLA